MLRGAIVRHPRMIRYLAFYLVNNENTYHVFAQANEKISPMRWKDMLGLEFKSIVECNDLRGAIVDAQFNETLEQYGRMYTRVRNPTVETRSIGTQTEPVVFADRLEAPVKRVPFPGYRDYGAEMEAAFRIPPKSIIEGLPPYKIPYLTSRKVYLRESGVDVPDDYDSSIEKSREFEQQLRERRAVEDEALKIQATSGSIRKKPRKGVPKRLVVNADEFDDGEDSL